MLYSMMYTLKFPTESFVPTILVSFSYILSTLPLPYGDNRSEYRKIKRPFPPTARAHLAAPPAPPEATSQPFPRPLASPARHTLGCSRECTPAGTVAKEG